MPIIKNKKITDISSIKAKVNPVILNQIEEYCHWAGIYDIGYFIEKAAHFMFLNDEEWKRYQHEMHNAVSKVD